ncbi:regulatory protein GemA [bacterium]|nr:regulatory protein GemA [bacterium]
MGNYRAAATHEMPISKEQIKIIHTLKSKMGMSDSDYRQRLWRVGVKSCKEMSFEQAKRFIHNLKIACAKKTGKTYARSGHGVARISDAQMAMIRAMWAEISYLGDTDDREVALNKLVSRLYHVRVLSWLPRWQVPKLVRTLEVMQHAEQAAAAMH